MIWLNPRTSEVHVPVSVEVLREADGALDLPEITKRTAKRMGWSLMYFDVDSVLHAAEARGEVRCVRYAGDIREQTWEAI